jgi:hypothetical protein
MDHLLEHESESIPDSSSIASASHGGTTDGDEEDAQALERLGASGVGEQEAKVCVQNQIPQFWRPQSFCGHQLQLALVTDLV